MPPAARRAVEEVFLAYVRRRYPTVSGRSSGQANEASGRVARGWGGRRTSRRGASILPALLAAMSARRRAGVFVSGRTGWVRHPARLRAQHLGAPSYQRVYRLEKAPAVGAQLIRDKVAWKIRRPRAGRCLRLFVRSGNNLPTCLWKPWISRNLLSADASALRALKRRRRARLYAVARGLRPPKGWDAPRNRRKEREPIHGDRKRSESVRSAWVLVSQEGRQLAGRSARRAPPRFPFSRPEAQVKSPKRSRRDGRNGH